MGSRSKRKTASDRAATRARNRATHDPERLTVNAFVKQARRPLPDPRRQASWSAEDGQRWIQHLAEKKGMWAGIPIPLEGFAITVEPRYENGPAFMRVTDRREMAPGEFTCRDTDIDDTMRVHNSWYSARAGGTVIIYSGAETGGKSRAVVDRRRNTVGERFTFWLNTAGASQAWDMKAEERAMEKLASLIPAHLFDMYRLTGTFMETSPRSKVTYLLRRARPTVAMVPTDRNDPNKPMRFLTALCMHPIAYYRETWAGAMVPTDDVIAHLLMIRADEHLFWKRAYHHDGYEPEAGL